MKFFSLVSSALAYNVDMTQTSMRKTGQRNVVLEQDEDVTMRFEINSGTGYSWISNLDTEGKTVSLLERFTEKNEDRVGATVGDFWKVRGVG